MSGIQYDNEIAAIRAAMMNIDPLNPKNRAKLRELGAKFAALVDKKYEGESWNGSVDLTTAGIGDGDGHPARMHCPAMPGEIDEESPRRF